MKTLRLSPIPITSNNFSACGELIMPPLREPDVKKEGVKFWDEAVTCEIDGKPDIGFLMLRKRAFHISQMERHLTHTQGFIPLNGAKLLLAAAPPTEEDKPDLYAIKAYMLDGSCGFMLHRGTWHDILYPLDADASLITLLRVGTSTDDMFIVNLVESFGVEIRVDIDSP